MNIAHAVGTARENPYLLWRFCSAQQKRGNCPARAGNLRPRARDDVRDAKVAKELHWLVGELPLHAALAHDRVRGDRHGREGAPKRALPQLPDTLPRRRDDRSSRGPSSTRRAEEARDRASRPTTASAWSGRPPEAHVSVRASGASRRDASCRAHSMASSRSVAYFSTGRLTLSRASLRAHAAAAGEAESASPQKMSGTTPAARHTSAPPSAQMT